MLRYVWGCGIDALLGLLFVLLWIFIRKRKRGSRRSYWVNKDSSARHFDYY